MVFRIFNKDVPVRNLLFVIGEGILIYVAVLVAAFLRLGSVHASFLSGEVISKAILIMVVCQISLYYNELYNLKVTDTYVELGLRLTKAMGVASIVLAIIYYFVPSLMMGRGIFFYWSCISCLTCCALALCIQLGLEKKCLRKRS